MIARLEVTRGTLTEYPLAEKVGGGWQNGVTFYTDDEVTRVTPLVVSPQPDEDAEQAALEWLRNYHGSIDSTALVMAFRAGFSRSRLPRVVKSVEELEALPVGSVVLGPRGRSWQKHDPAPYYHQWMCGDGGFVRHGAPADPLLPATVLFTPDSPTREEGN